MHSDTPHRSLRRHPTWIVHAILVDIAMGQDRLSPDPTAPVHPDPVCIDYKAYLSMYLHDTEMSASVVFDILVFCYVPYVM